MSIIPSQNLNSLKKLQFKNSNFGIDLDGSKHDVLPFPPKFLLLTMGPKKYKISNSKFIVVQRGPEVDIVRINTVLP